MQFNLISKDQPLQGYARQIIERQSAVLKIFPWVLNLFKRKENCANKSDKKCLKHRKIKIIHKNEERNSNSLI